MKNLKLIVKIIIFCTIFIGGQALIKYAILDDTMTISRVMLHDLYTEEKNIDILFCGASHCQLGVDPVVMDEGFGMNTFNAGSSSQGLETTLALIKEADRYHDLKQVYVDLDYSIVMREIPNLESIYIISDYMKPSMRKVEYLLNATSFDYYVNSFMPLHKGRGYTANPKKIIEILQKKSSRGYRDYVDRDSSYAGKGHIASRTVVEEGTLWSGEELQKRNFIIPAEQQENLQKIIAFCERRDIQLTFVSIPVTDFHLSQVQNYDEYVAAVQELLSEYGVPYYDFNLCNPSILPLDKDSYFNDDNHLNQDGAKVFGKVFSDFFTGQVEERTLFMDSYEAKLAVEEPRILGILVEWEESELAITPLANRKELQIDCQAERVDGGYLIMAAVDGVITNRVEIKDEELK
ncbi:MAG: SGNH/GDSL hydrolase family protein [Clostridiales bacterium]|nr:SGNH/GDSL hydrolase family protein [Clostridiales bacterium]